MKKKKPDVESKVDEEFLENKRKKAWIDIDMKSKCIMVYPRALYVTWGAHENWIWSCFKETSDENIEVVKLSHVCWLDVRGKLKISELSSGVVYEIIYVVKLTNGASGWELPIRLKLSLPNGQIQERQISLLEKPKGKWLELNVGNFLTENHIAEGEVCFDLYEHGGHWKTGLIIKGAILRPKK